MPDPDQHEEEQAGWTIEREGTLCLTMAFLLSGCPPQKQQSQDPSEAWLLPLFLAEHSFHRAGTGYKASPYNTLQYTFVLSEVGVHNPSLRSPR